MFDRLIRDRIRREGRMTLAAFMRTALYDEAHGYYTTADQRSGRAGDFYTSVDAGTLFGELIATLVAREAARRGDDRAPFDLVEAGAGNGRLMHDVLDVLSREAPDVYVRLRVTLVEASPAARAVAATTLARHAGCVAFTDHGTLPGSIDGCLLANELLDAMPAHHVVSTSDGLRETWVDVDGDRLVLDDGPLSTPRLRAYCAESETAVPTGHAVDISLDAVDWVEDAASRLVHGSLVLIDYGDTFAGLGARRRGTLTAFKGHRIANVDDAETTWLAQPGAWDMTTHVDWSMVTRLAQRAGLEVTPVVDQTRFLMALDLEGRLPPADDTSLAGVRRRLAASTLVSPQGLGASHQACVMRRGGERA